MVLPVQRTLLIKGPVLALVRRRLLDIGFALAGLGLALQFTVVRFYENQVPPGGPLPLLEGTYAAPFQYWVLVPLTVHGLLKVPTGLSFMWVRAAFDLAAVLGLCFVMRCLVLRFTDIFLLYFATILQIYAFPIRIRYSWRLRGRSYPCAVSLLSYGTRASIGVL